MKLECLLVRYPENNWKFYFPYGVKSRGLSREYISYGVIFFNTLSPIGKLRDYGFIQDEGVVFEYTGDYKDLGSIMDYEITGHEVTEISKDIYNQHSKIKSCYLSMSDYEKEQAKQFSFEEDIVIPATMDNETYDKLVSLQEQFSFAGCNESLKRRLKKQGKVMNEHSFSDVINKCIELTHIDMETGYDKHIEKIVQSIDLS